MLSNNQNNSWDGEEDDDFDEDYDGIDMEENKNQLENNSIVPSF